jgi:hypothetical protein
LFRARFRCNDSWTSVHYLVGGDLLVVLAAELFHVGRVEEPVIRRPG